MTKNEVNSLDSVPGFLSWLVSNLSVERENQPKCKRSAMTKLLAKTKFVPFKLQWIYRFSQPAHLLVVVVSLCFSLLIFPRDVATTHSSQPPSILSSLIYSICVATHFGTQFWMTFASGLVLFFSLPRHVFGAVQQCLFPKYFTLNAFLSAITFLIFAFYHPPSASNSFEIKLQTWNLLLCFVCEFCARLCVVPTLLEALQERMRLEEGAGVGMEVGRHDPGRLRYCPHYKIVDRQFRLYHGLCACANVTSMACSALHIYYVACCLKTALM